MEERQEALYFLQGESPCCVRSSQPPILSPLFSIARSEATRQSRNHGGYSSFVFPHLCLAKSKACPTFILARLFNNYFPKKEGFLKLV